MTISWPSKNNSKILSFQWNESLPSSEVIQVCNEDGHNAQVRGGLCGINPLLFQKAP